MKKRTLLPLIMALILFLCSVYWANPNVSATKSNVPDSTIETIPTESLPDQTHGFEASPSDDEQSKHRDIPVGSTFEVHFIDVGQGDCSLILCDGKAMIIDGGEASESSKVYA